jgi:hypothetical protein
MGQWGLIWKMEMNSGVCLTQTGIFVGGKPTFWDKDFGITRLSHGDTRSRRRPSEVSGSPMTLLIAFPTIHC